MSAVDPVAPSRQMPRWAMIVLIVSLALNLLVLGLVAGAFWRFHFWHRPGLSANVLGYVTTLPPERRKELWGRSRDARKEIRPLRKEVRDARDEVFTALGADPFDKERLVAAQARLLKADMQARGAAQKLFAEIAADMTPEERRAFLKWREGRRPPPPPNALDADGDRPPPGPPN